MEEGKGRAERKASGGRRRPNRPPVSGTLAQRSSNPRPLRLWPARRPNRVLVDANVHGRSPQAYVPPVLAVRDVLLIYVPFFAVKSALPPAVRALHSQAAAAPAPSSTAQALSLIRTQPSQYLIASIAGRKYLLAPRDLLTVPRLRDASVGDVLALDRIHEVGSRDYTIRGNPELSPEAVRVEATVVEHTKGKMEHIFKKKRRKGYERTIMHKQTYTRLRIGPLDIRPPASS